MKSMADYRKDFPILQNHPDVVYFDSTATSLKPQVVIDAISHYYTHFGANIHRGIYDLSESATEAFEETRSVVAEFLNASEDEIIFTRGTTESMNLLGYTVGEQIVEEGDEVVATLMEHHANFVTWQQLAARKKAKFKVVEIDENGDLDIGHLDKYIGPKTKIFACTYVSNVLGIINPIVEIVKAVRSINPNTLIVIDAAQAVPHIKVDVRDIDCDFLAFSAHKMCGPTGVGVLYGKRERLAEMRPFMYGGDMILNVFVDSSTYQEPPYRFEAGTPHISGIIAFKESIRYLQEVTFEAIEEHEKKLSDLFMKLTKESLGDRLIIMGENSKYPRVAVMAMAVKNTHPHDLADLLNDDHMCVRAGHHCAMPLHSFFKIPASTRASMYFYNTEEEITRFVESFVKAVDLFS